MALRERTKADCVPTGRAYESRGFRQFPDRPFPALHVIRQTPGLRANRTRALAATHRAHFGTGTEFDRAIRCSARFRRADRASFAGSQGPHRTTSTFTLSRIEIVFSRLDFLGCLLGVF